MLPDFQLAPKFLAEVSRFPGKHLVVPAQEPDLTNTLCTSTALTYRGNQSVTCDSARRGNAASTMLALINLGDNR